MSTPASHRTKILKSLFDSEAVFNSELKIEINLKAKTKVEIDLFMVDNFKNSAKLLHFYNFCSTQFFKQGQVTTDGCKRVIIGPLCD